MDATVLPPGRAELLPPVLQHAPEPFRGVTIDGTPIPNLFRARDTGWDPSPAVRCARAFLDLLTPEAATRAAFPIDAPEWRIWTNAFPTWKPHGVSLEELDGEGRRRVLSIVKACSSASGFTEIQDTMNLNAALGELIGQYTDTLTNLCYRLAIFGTPSVTEPWGWQLWGHHLDLHCFILGRQLVLTPAFLGAEPCIADRGTYAGTRLFDQQRHRALDLRRSLRASQSSAAVLHPSMRNEDLPSELNHPVDGRHLAGAGRDNRTIPYAGIRATVLDPGQRELLLHLIESYASRAPETPAELLMQQSEEYLHDTHFAWVGGNGDEDAFYYRVHSPVLLIEYDCHAGVFLDNDQPEPFHVHTIVRTPNGGDYGKALLAEHLRLHHHTDLAGRAAPTVRGSLSHSHSND